MLRKVLPTVVTILVTGATAEPVALPPRLPDGTLPPTPTPAMRPFRAGASGVVVDRTRGHILTNSHVVQDSTRIEVVLSDGRRMLARVVGHDPATDIAVIAVDERKLPELPLGDSDRMRVGDLVVAVGNPYGLEGTATLGIISALMRTDGAFEDFMQIDASIHPGNSGGALVNVRGELIGINTAGAADRSKGAGIGFAIPINMAKAITSQLLAQGRVQRGSPGLIVEDLTHEAMRATGTATTRGAYILDVVPGSPAALSGLRPGGIVVNVAGKPVRSAAEFHTRIGTVPIGATVPTTVSEGAGTNVYPLAMADIMMKPAETVVSPTLGGLSGVVLGNIGLGHRLYGQVRGVEVLKVPPGTRAHVMGLAQGDIVVGLDGSNVADADDVLRLADRAGMQFRLRLIRNGTPGWLVVTR
jgi:S1-C subfamily serine protease